MKGKTTRKTILIQRVSHISTAKVEEALGKPVKAKKTRYGVALMAKGGFSSSEAIIIAEALGCRYNGKCIV